VARSHPRILQGAGAALVTPACLAIVGVTFENAKERTVAVAVWTGVAALALALGPIAGGVLSQYVGWFWIFFINVPIGVATMALAAWAIDESRDPATARHIDVGGLITSASWHTNGSSLRSQAPASTTRLWG
jgi:MFS family permease